MKNGATEIQARLWPNNGRWYGYGSNWVTIENNSHIYVVYEKKEDATSGGSPTVPSDAPDAQKPTILKESTPNTDGTSTLGLSITGYANDVDPDKLADVIVVFDVSGSMSRDISSTTDRGTTDSRSRMYQLRNAVNNLADTLLSEDYENAKGEKLIRMSLVTFSTISSSASAFTDDPDVFKGWVNNLGADGGTNWDRPCMKLI